VCTPNTIEVATKVMNVRNRSISDDVIVPHHKLLP
jgi:hypothetical protein